MDNVESLLLRGKREEAVHEAIASKNFTMALLVSSMCGRETFQDATRQFADEVFLSGSPLHTLAMLFSGQLHPPEDSTLHRGQGQSLLWGGSAQELLATWRHHLAAIISNRILGWDRIVLSLGDRLLNLGDIHAAHFCYMVCGCPVTSPLNASSRVSLVGTDHLAPMSRTLMVQESLESYERTEAYEWAKRRGNPQAAIQALQPFKLKYAMLLADSGLEKEAVLYVQSIRQCAGLDNSERKVGMPLNFATLSHREAFLAALDDFGHRLSPNQSPFPHESHLATPTKAGSGVVPSMSNFSPKSSPMNVTRAGTSRSMPKMEVQTHPHDASHNTADHRRLNGGNFPKASQKAVTPVADTHSRPRSPEIDKMRTPPGAAAKAHPIDDDPNVSFLSAKSNLLDVTSASFVDKPSEEINAHDRKGHEDRSSISTEKEASTTPLLAPCENQISPNVPPAAPVMKKVASSGALNSKGAPGKPETPQAMKPRIREAPKSAPVFGAPGQPLVQGMQQAPSSEKSTYSRISNRETPSVCFLIFFFCLIF